MSQTFDVRESINVALIDLVPSKNQARKVGKKCDYVDLIASMEKHGLIQPITIRKLKGGKYEIIVGHRRAKAAEFLEWAYIDANVVAVENPVADEMRVIENLHRKNLTPLEEGKEIATLLKKHKPEEVGHLLNLTLPQIARRQKLSTLSKKWVKLISNPTDELDVSRWPTTSYEEVARLPEASQNELLDELINDYEAASMTTIELHNHIDRKFVFNLDKVSWDLASDEIAGKMACNKCPLRANCQESLFDDMEGDNKCLNQECFNEKSAFVKSEIAWTAVEKYGDDTILIDEDLTYAQEGRKYLGRYDVNKCKKSDPGAKRAVYVSGSTAGKPVWINKGNTAGGGSKKTGPIDDAIRLERVEKKRAKYLTEKMIAMLGDNETQPDLTQHDIAIALTSFVAVFGVSTGADTRVSWHDESAWSHAYVRSDENPSVSKNWCDIFENVEADGLVLMNTIWNQARMVLIDHFEFLLKYSPSLREVEFCLGLIKQDSFYDVWYEEAVNAVNMPKSLAKLYDKYGIKIEGVG